MCWCSESLQGSPKWLDPIKESNTPQPNCPHCCPTPTPSQQLGPAGLGSSTAPGCPCWGTHGALPPLHGHNPAGRSIAGSSHNIQKRECVSSKELKALFWERILKPCSRQCSGVPCYAQVENHTLFPKAAEDVGEPGLQLKTQQEDAQRRSLLFPSILHFSIPAAFIMLQIVLATVPLPLMFIQSNC